MPFVVHFLLFAINSSLKPKDLRLIRGCITAF